VISRCDIIVASLSDCSAFVTEFSNMSDNRKLRLQISLALVSPWHTAAAVKGRFADGLKRAGVAKKIFCEVSIGSVARERAAIAADDRSAI
jgi:hypothetical protein